MDSLCDAALMMLSSGSHACMCVQRTAKDCSAHLTAMKLPPMTFLPPDALKTPASGCCIGLACVPLARIEAVSPLQRTAKDCIAHLKAMKLPPMTFLPLDTLKTRPVDAHLRALGGSAKLALDLITFDQYLERAFLFACGCVLHAVCEDSCMCRLSCVHLRALGGSAKLALDLTTVHEYLERTFLFACG